MTRTLAIAFGGALGTVARYWLALLALPLSRQLPVGTIAINVLGSFAIGAFGTLTLAGGRVPLGDTARLFFMVGVCGGFTTFSAFSLQTLDLMRGGAPGRAILNVALSVMLCLMAVAAGHYAASWVNGGARAIAANVVEEEAS